MRSLKLMADYQCHPLWRDDWDPSADVSGPMIEEMAELGLDDGLIERLDAWARRFDSSLNWNDPGGPSLWNNQQWLDFYREGAVLATQTEACLKERFSVRYHHVDDLARLEILIASSNGSDPS